MKTFRNSQLTMQMFILFLKNHHLGDLKKDLKMLLNEPQYVCINYIF